TATTDGMLSRAALDPIVPVATLEVVPTTPETVPPSTLPFEDLGALDAGRAGADEGAATAGKAKSLDAALSCSCRKIGFTCITDCNATDTFWFALPCGDGATQSISIIDWLLALPCAFISRTTPVMMVPFFKTTEPFDFKSSFNRTSTVSPGLL